MESDVQNMLDTFADLRKEANVNACFGEPVTVEGRTIVPVARVGYALGLGKGQEPVLPAHEEGPEGGAGGTGGRGGVVSSPLGVVEVTAGETRIRHVVDRQTVLIAGLLVGAWCVYWVARALTVLSCRAGEAEE